VKTAAAQKPKPTTTDEPEELSPELKERFFTRADVLRILGNPHPDTLDRWKRAGIGPAQTVLPGRQVVFSQDSFWQWMKNREQQPRRSRAAAGTRRR
jgi:hypothetical protein